MINVVDIVKYLDYPYLVRLNIIPSDIFNDKIPKKTLPKWATDQKQQFEQFTNLIFRYYLGDSTIPNISNLGTVRQYDSNLFYQLALNERLECDINDINGSQALYNKCQQLSAKVAEYGPFSYGTSAQPNLVGSTHIFDIRSVYNFEPIKIELILKLLTYAVLSNNFSKVGVILPFNDKILLYDLTKWDHTKYTSVLSDIIQTIKVPPIITDITAVVGHHIPKMGTILQSLMNMDRTQFGQCFDNHGLSSTNSIEPQCEKKMPCQMFLSTPNGRSQDSQTSLGTHSEKVYDDLVKSREFILANKIKFFVHAPYTINLARPPGPELTKNIITLAQQLVTTWQVGGQGVVVHVGSACHFKNSSQNPIGDGMIMMKYSLDLLMQYIQPGCPLLIETSAGEGMEVYTDSDVLYELVKGYPSDKLNICIDTCHVFVNGHCPLQLLNRIGERVKLIHFNDSTARKGSHKDSHALYGNGYLGYDLMTRILLLASDKGIPCIIE